MHMRHWLHWVPVAAVAILGLATPASSADLGGNCCADLEERIAELEATTARKGNRKVSLTVSGWVTQQVMYWDDGFEDNVYVIDAGSTIASHVKFTGEAQIASGWSAGYVLHLEAIGSDSLGVDQDIASANAVISGDRRGVQTLQSFWFLKSDQLGKVSVGLQSQASDNTAILVDGSGSLVPANFVEFDYGNFAVRESGTGVPGVAWATLQGCTDCNGLPENSVRYDSPTLAGFSVSASWGEDDFWDVAARYAGEFAGFKLAVAAAYSESTDDNVQGVGAGASFIDETHFFQVGAYVQHVPSGVFVYGAYGHFESKLSDLALVLAPGVPIVGEEHEFWYVKAGLRQRWSALGHTVLYGEYKNTENGVFPFSAPGIFDFDSETEMYGAGLVQEIDAAAMSLWLKYRHVQGDLSLAFLGTAQTFNLDDFDYVALGGLINF